MTITNTVNEIPGFDGAELQLDSLDLYGDEFLNISVLEAMSNEYFPELFPQGVSEKQSSIQDVVSNSAQGTKEFSKEKFLKSITDTLELDDADSDFKNTDTVTIPIMGVNQYDQSGKPNESSQFSFLEDARCLFMDTRNSRGKAQGEIMAGSYENISFEPLLVSAVESSVAGFDVASIRRDFPILGKKVDGKNLVWLDNAATTQKPKSVIDRLSYFYEYENSNVHRGAHTLAARSTDAYEGARKKISSFINASSPTEIVFVRGATEGINLVAHSWGKYNLQKDDEIILSLLEHHANIVPWQMICAETGAKLRIVPVDETGQVLLHEYDKILSSKTKIVAITHVSNALGTIIPVAEMVSRAHKYGARVLVDGAQAISHLKVDVQALDCDFYVFSGHKVFGPTGIGVLYGKSEILNAIGPYQGGGNMITDVTFAKTVYQTSPNRFEAGTGNIADAVGLGAAIDYVNSIGIENINRYEHHLLEYGMEALGRIPGLRLIGTAKEKAGVLSFVLKGFTTEEIGHVLSQAGIAVRSGHHCAQPILRNFGLESTVRPSLAFYNTYDEIDMLVAVLQELNCSHNFG